MFIIALLVDLSIGKFLNKGNNKKEIGKYETGKIRLLISWKYIIYKKVTKNISLFFSFNCVKSGRGKSSEKSILF